MSIFKHAQVTWKRITCRDSCVVQEMLELVITGLRVIFRHTHVHMHVHVHTRVHLLIHLLPRMLALVHSLTHTQPVTKITHTNCMPLAHARAYTLTRTNSHTHTQTHSQSHTHTLKTPIYVYVRVHSRIRTGSHTGECHQRTHTRIGIIQMTYSEIKHGPVTMTKTLC